MSAEAARALFQQTWGGAPDVIASAPGRVNLIGEHTDYNGGQVMPIAIDKRTWVAIARAPGSLSHAVSAQQDAAGEFRLGIGGAQGAWWDYLHGAMRAVPGAAALPGVLAAVVSDVPVAAGLSSSAALSVASAAAAAALCSTAEHTSCTEFARRAHDAEVDFVGVPCGIMDQTASACTREGHALRLWCDTMEMLHVPFDREVLIIDSKTPRELRRSDYRARKGECDQALAMVQHHYPEVSSLGRATLDQLAASALTGVLYQRARHVVTEVARVEEVARRLAMPGRPSLGDVLLASHDSLRDDYECSTPELNWIVECARATSGVDGARLTGAGWGGCAVALGSVEGLVRLSKFIQKEFVARWGREASVWHTRAFGGARIDFIRQ